MSQHTDDPYFFPRDPEGLARILNFGFGAANAHFDNCPAWTSRELSQLESARINRLGEHTQLDGDMIRNIMKCFKLDQRGIWAAYRRREVISSTESSGYAVSGPVATHKQRRDSAVDSRQHEESSGVYSVYSNSNEDPESDDYSIRSLSQSEENVAEEEESSFAQNYEWTLASAESEEDELLDCSGLDTALEVAFQLQRTGAISESSEYHSLLTSAPRYSPAFSQNRVVDSLDNFNVIAETLRSWSALSSLSVFCRDIIQSIDFVPISRQHWSSYFTGTAQFSQLSSDVLAAGMCCRHCGEIFPIFSMQSLGSTLQRLWKTHFAKDCQTKMRSAIMKAALLTQEAESKHLAHLNHLCQMLLLKLGPKIFGADTIGEWKLGCSRKRRQKKRKLISEQLSSLKKHRGPGSWVCDAELPAGEVDKMYRENRQRLRQHSCCKLG
eukprot:CAMPEP_0113580450 /NCGR_PEP_ID=MMETSP0015_2-20120614/30690_1 /TAXON_ID=2838 /ORGANISM="Odontella" /LENGTH=439 /DNA_ID=CAMNT_0000484661 /DNA_START=273 /DNA_END=1592 /DNA_ORIENTATION=- /assembly_acc=CAM_ASM_000160